MTYSLDDIIAWATMSAKAYADARAQGLACIGFYNNLRNTQ